MDKINISSREAIIASANSSRWEVGEDFHDSLMQSIYADAAEIAGRAVIKKDEKNISLGSKD